MNDVQIGSLPVPGAHLHYEARGTGPLLLMIPGAPADAGAPARRLGVEPLVFPGDHQGLAADVAACADIVHAVFA